MAVVKFENFIKICRFNQTNFCDFVCDFSSKKFFKQFTPLYLKLKNNNSQRMSKIGKRIKPLYSGSLANIKEPAQRF